MNLPLWPLGLLAGLCLPPLQVASQEAALEPDDAGGASAAREPLEPLVDIGPIPPPQWKVIEPRSGPSSDTFSLKRSVAEFLVEDTILQASSRTGFIAYSKRGPYRNVVFRNSIVTVAPGTIPLDRSYWAIRGYDMIDTLFERVEITGFGKITPKHDEGHAIYLNVAGSLTLTSCNIHHNGGQGLQVVNRPGETVLPVGPAAGTITIRNTSFRENGFNPDRGGFQVSLFGTGQAIVLEDVEILAGLDGTPFPGDRTGGGLLIEVEAFNPRRPEKPVWWHPGRFEAGWKPPFGQGRTELTRVRVQHVNPDKSLVQIKGCQELIVTDCDFRGGSIQLDHPRKPGRDCGRIEWRGNRGDALVFFQGSPLGRADEDFVIQP